MKALGGYSGTFVRGLCLVKARLSPWYECQYRYGPIRKWGFLCIYICMFARRLWGMTSAKQTSATNEAAAVVNLDNTHVGVSDICRQFYVFYLFT